MLVKAKEKQISFLFQERDPFFEIGCRILEQEHIDQMLPFTRINQRGREKLVYQADGESLVLLSDIVPKLEEKDLVNLLCGMIFLNMKVEENGFLKKECIWCKYDNLYYDKGNGCIKAAILPITGELRYADGASWHGQFEETMTCIASYLPADGQQYLRKLVLMLKMGELTQEEALERLQHMGGGVSETMQWVQEHQQDIILRLLYRGKGRELEFLIDSEDFLIGRNAAVADGVITAEYSRAVSRRHCLITNLNHKYFVQDLKSVNHTLVNGIMIPPYELMELENNDILSVGDIEFRVTTSVS
ncbi:MAG: FHA domain-containing protein [Lachnospiraceae bacterium]|nr:FHA domain-containing protein [Lachnospiraceae bacterium]